MDCRQYLSQEPFDVFAAKLLEKAYGKGFLCLVLCDNKDHLEHLDHRLWTFSQKGFLPHAPLDPQGNPLDPIVLFDGDFHDFVNLEQRHLLLFFSTHPRIQQGASSFEALFKSAMEKGFTQCVDMVDGGFQETLSLAKDRHLFYQKVCDKVTFWEQSKKGAWHQKS